MEQRSWSKEPASRWLSARRDVLTWGEEALRVSHCDVASSQHHVLEDGQGAIVGDVEADVPGVGLKERLLHACED